MKSINFKKIYPIMAGILGVIGVGVTAYIASVDTAKYVTKESATVTRNFKSKETKSEKKQVIKDALKTYAPTIASTVLTGACIISGTIVGHKAQIALISAYAALEQSYKRYQDKNIDINGLENHQAIKKAIAKDMFNETVVIKTETLLFYDDFLEAYFENDMETVTRAEYYINKALIKHGFATLNQYLSFLGRAPVSYGDTVGWNKHDEWITFNHDRCTIDDDLTCLIVSFENQPRILY